MSEKTMKYLEYYKLNASENEDDIRIICETANKRLSTFNTKFSDWKLLGAFFCKTFESILMSLKKLEKEWSSFEINFCDRFVVGYSTSDNEDDEKNGNFVPYIRHISAEKKEYNYDSESTANSKFASWVMDNLNSQVDLINKIAGEAIPNLKEIGIALTSSDAVIVIFTIIYETIVSYLKAKRANEGEFEYEINFLNCFYIGVQESEDGAGDVYIRPNIANKLFIKDDTVASSKYE